MPRRSQTTLLVLTALVALLAANAEAAGSESHRRVVIQRRQAAGSSVSVPGAAGPTSATPAGGGGNNNNNNGGANGNNGGANGNNGGGNAQPTTTPAADDNANGGGGGIGGLISTIIDPAKQTTPAVVVVSVPAVVSSAVARPTSSAVALTTSKPLGPTVVQITSTSTFSAPPISTVPLNGTALPVQTDNSSSGLPKGTLIAIIVVASCAGVVGLIWTCIRKWKLSPSRRFEDKLVPVDYFDPAGPADVRHAGAGFNARGYGGLESSSSVGVGLPPVAALSRSGSSGSSAYGGGGAHLKRGNSFGSVVGSQRGGAAPPPHLMSEASYNQHPYGPPAGAYAYGQAPVQMAPGQQPYAPSRGPGALANPYGSNGGLSDDYDPSFAPAPGGGYARY